MARAAFNLMTQLSFVICHDEADGPGTAEPYLWPVFFKIDGNSFAVDSFGLIGFPRITRTNGNHRNIGAGNVGDSDQISIPRAVGTNTTSFRPIPVNDPNYRVVLGEDLAGIAGVVVVLMEQDSWPDDFATTGYNALVEAVTLGVAKIAASFQANASAPTSEDIDEQLPLVEELVKKMVKGAILEQMSGVNIARFGTVGNNDDTIGTKTFMITQDDFANGNSKNFSHRWRGNETSGGGDWSITGRFVNLDGSPRPVDLKECAKIAEEIISEQEKLNGEETLDINEMKDILKTIGRLKDKSQRLGCPKV